MGKVRVPVSPHRAVPQHPREQESAASLHIPCSLGHCCYKVTPGIRLQKSHDNLSKGSDLPFEDPCAAVAFGKGDREGLGCVGCSRHRGCAMRKKDELLLACGEGLPGHSALRVHWRSSQTADLTKSIRSQLFAVINDHV